jgi:hypothetical protein
LVTCSYTTAVAVAGTKRKKKLKKSGTATAQIGVNVGAIEQEEGAEAAGKEALLPGLWPLQLKASCRTFY